MKGAPIYLQPVNTLYRLRSDSTPRILTTGRTLDKQFLIVVGYLLEFDNEGQFLSMEEHPQEELWPVGLEAKDDPIDLLRFWLPDLQMGISDFPLGCPDLPSDPTEFTEETWEWLRASQWGDGKMFTLQLGKDRGELWIDNTGVIHLHSY